MRRRPCFGATLIGSSLEPTSYIPRAPGERSRPESLRFHQLFVCREFELWADPKWAAAPRFSNQLCLNARPERFELPTSWFVGRRSFRGNVLNFHGKSGCVVLNILTGWLPVSH